MDKNCSNILSLIEDIYETVNDNSHWQSVLRQLAAYVENGKASITSRDNVTGRVDVLDLAITKIVGVSDKLIYSYLSEVYEYDLWIPIEEKHNVGELCIFSEHLPIEELKKTDYYKSWLALQSITDGIAIQIFKTEHFRVVLNVFYNEKSDNIKGLHQTLRILIPHLKNAISLWMQSNGINQTSTQKVRSQYLRSTYKVTKRELEIVSAYFRIGNANQVADMHGIKEGTMWDHVKNVRRKMHCKSTHELMLKLFSFADQSSQ